MSTREDSESAGTVTKSGKPEKRVRSAGAALAIYKRLVDKSSEGAIMRANVQNLFDGNPPIPPSDQERHGIKWATNIDHGEFRADINRHVGALWNMFIANVENLVDAVPLSKDPQNPGVDWGQVLARELSDIITQHPSFHSTLIPKLLDMFKFGPGFSYWRDKNEWMSYYARTGSVMFEASEKSNVGSFQMLFIRDEINLFELMRHAGIDGDKDNEEAARESGWNTKYLRKKLVEIFKEGTYQEIAKKYAVSEWESMAQSYKNYDTFEQDISELDPVRIVWCYAEEVGKTKNEEPLWFGPVSQYLLLEGDDSSLKDCEYLFGEEEAFDSMLQVIHVILFTVNEGWMRSVRGLGRELFSPSHISNRLLNSLLTGVDIASGLLLKHTNSESAERATITRHANITVIPSDVELLQQQYMPNIKQAADAREIIGAVKNNTAGIYKQNNESGRARTAEEVRYLAGSEARFEGNQSEWYYTCWELWLVETIRRLMNPKYPKNTLGYSDHKKLMDRLTALEMPENLRKSEAWSFRARRAIGMGSPTMRRMIVNDMVRMKPSLDEAGRRQVDREWFAANVGWRNVDRFVPMVSREDTATMAHSLAEGENFDVLAGNARTVSVDDPHKIHLDQHVRFAIGIIKAVQQNGIQSIERDARALEIMVAHIGGHLQLMAADPTRKAQLEYYLQTLEVIKTETMKLVQVANQVVAQREQQKKDQQQTMREAERTLASREFDLEKYKIDKNAELERYKADQLNTARESKTITALQVSVQRMQGELEMLRTKTMAEIERKAMETAAKVAREAAGKES